MACLSACLVQTNWNNQIDSCLLKSEKSKTKSKEINRNIMHDWILEPVVTTIVLVVPIASTINICLVDTHCLREIEDNIKGCIIYLCHHCNMIAVRGEVHSLHILVKVWRWLTTAWIFFPDTPGSSIKIVKILMKYTSNKDGSSWSWSHGGWIYNYLCN